VLACGHYGSSPYASGATGQTPAVSADSFRHSSRHEAQACGTLSAKMRMRSKFERDQKLFIEPLQGGARSELRERADGSILTDDRNGWGWKIIPTEGGITANGNSSELYKRAPEMPAKPVPPEWSKLVGEYGSDYKRPLHHGSKQSAYGFARDGLCPAHQSIGRRLGISPRQFV
jgi:hypothetical protein